MIYTKIDINGNEIPDSYKIIVNKSTGENNSSSSFTAQIENQLGYNSDTFSIGDSVEVYADKSNPPTTKIFDGIVNNIRFKGKANNEVLILDGKDNTYRLTDRTVEPEVYSNLPAGSIVKDIINKYASGITTNNTDNTSTTISRISFNHKPVFDAVRELARQSNHVFYVDENKDLNFKPKSSVNSNLIFNSGNVVKSNFREKRESVFNEVWVYGDRFLDAYEESFVGDGGSVFTLQYKPRDVGINVDGGSVQPGGIFGLTNEAGSNVKFLISYHDKQVIFTSGANQGDNIPGIGSPVIVNYSRDLPIVKVGKDNNSISKYGKRVKVIVDKDIKDPATAEKVMATTLSEESIPVKEGNLDIEGVVDVTPSNTCIVNLPFENIVNKTYDIVEARYDFNKKSNLSEDVLKVKVNKKIGDVTDTLKQMLLDIKKLQGGEISESDTLTRFEFNTGSVGIDQKAVRVYQNVISGGFILGNPRFSALGSGTEVGVLGEPGSTYGEFFVGTNGSYEDNLNDNDFILAGSTTANLSGGVLYFKN